MTPVLAISNVEFGAGFVEELVALVLVAAFFYWKLWPMLRKAMAGRRAAIAEQLSAGEEARREGEALIAERRAELEAARGDATHLVEQARRSAEQLVAEGSRRAAEEYQRLVSRAATDAELERARLRDEVIAELSELVIAGAAEVVVAELDPARQHRLIGEAIDAAESEVA